MLGCLKKKTSPAAETKAVADIGRWGKMEVIGDRPLRDLAPEISQLIAIDPRNHLFLLWLKI
jgi:hypothetical protein